MGQIRHKVSRCFCAAASALERLRTRCYSLYKSLFFAQCGSNCRLFPSCKVNGGQNIHIGNNVIIRRDSVIAAQCGYKGQPLLSRVIIGDGVDLGDHCFISSANLIKIGEGTLSGRFLTLVDNGHGGTDMDTLRQSPSRRPVVSKGPIIIGKNVWLGEKVTVLAGVTIGDGAVVAAGSVVNKNVEPFTVVGGVPARVLGRKEQTAR